MILFIRAWPPPLYFKLFLQTHVGLMMKGDHAKNINNNDNRIGIFYNFDNDHLVSN